MSFLVLTSFQKNYFTSTYTIKHYRFTYIAIIRQRIFNANKIKQPSLD